MAFIDEEIAKKMKKERLKKQKAEQEKLEQELEATVDAEAVERGIINGKCTVLGREFAFETYTVCDGRFTIHIPSEEILIQKDEKELFKSANNELGFSCTITSTDEKEDFLPLEEYKQNMLKNMKKVTFKWLEEGAQMIGDCKVMYLDFITLTGIVNVHQNMWFVMSPYGQAQVVVNYDHAEDRYWKHIIKAIRNTFEINQK